MSSDAGNRGDSVGGAVDQPTPFPEDGKKALSNEAMSEGARRNTTQNVPNWISQRIRLRQRRRQRRRTESQSAIARASCQTAWATIAIAVLTAFSLIGIVSQAIIFNGQLGVMQSQLSIMGADQRPWVRLDIFHLDSIQFQNGGTAIQYTVSVKNVGSEPATRVSINIYYIVDEDLKSKKVLAVQAAMCNQVRTSTMPQEGTALFPGESSEPESRSGGEPPPYYVAAKGKVDYVPLYLFGCIDYALPTDRTHHHQTKFVYLAQMKSGVLIPRPTSSGVTTIEGNQLVLRRYDFGGFDAD